MSNEVKAIIDQAKAAIDKATWRPSADQLAEIEEQRALEREQTAVCGHSRQAYTRWILPIWRDGRRQVKIPVGHSRASWHYAQNPNWRRGRVDRAYCSVCGTQGPPGGKWCSNCGLGLRLSRFKRGIKSYSPAKRMVS